MIFEKDGQVRASLVQRHNPIGVGVRYNGSLKVQFGILDCKPASALDADRRRNSMIRLARYSILLDNLQRRFTWLTASRDRATLGKRPAHSHSIVSCTDQVAEYLELREYSFDIYRQIYRQNVSLERDSPR